MVFLLFLQPAVAYNIDILGFSPIVRTFVDIDGSDTLDFKPAPLYINPDYALISPDHYSLKMHKTPVIVSSEQFDIEVPDINVKGVRRYIHPFCQEASILVIQAVNGNKSAKRKVIKYII